MDVNQPWKNTPAMPPMPPPAPVKMVTPPPALGFARFLGDWQGRIVVCDKCTSSDVYKRSSHSNERFVWWQCHVCLNKFKVPRGIGDTSIAVAYPSA